MHPHARSGIPSCELAHLGTWPKLEPGTSDAVQEHCWEAGRNCPMGCGNAEVIHSFYGKRGRRYLDQEPAMGILTQDLLVKSPKYMRQNVSAAERMRESL